MVWFVSCRIPCSRRGFVVNDPVARPRAHANEKAAKEHVRTILRLLPLACVDVEILDDTDPSIPVLIRN
jgi:hypothetical protein